MCRNGVKLARELVRTPAFSEILESELHPGNEVQVGADWFEHCSNFRNKAGQGLAESVSASK